MSAAGLNVALGLASLIHEERLGHAAAFWIWGLTQPVFWEELRR